MHLEVVHATGRDYTPSVRLWGNLIPSLAALPVFVWAIREWVVVNPYRSIPMFVIAIMTLWLLTNYLGLWRNRALERALRGRYPGNGGTFVGFAAPGYRDWLDPHFDVGLLAVSDGECRFDGDRLRWSSPVSEVRAVRRRPNIHTWILLGGWIEIQTTAGSVFVEDRTRPTLLANFLRRRAFRLGLASHLAVSVQVQT